jgi:hypothetical protein
MNERLRDTLARVSTWDELGRLPRRGIVFGRAYVVRADGTVLMTRARVETDSHVRPFRMSAWPNADEVRIGGTYRTRTRLGSRKCRVTYTQGEAYAVARNVEHALARAGRSLWDGSDAPLRTMYAIRDRASDTLPASVCQSVAPLTDSHACDRTATVPIERVTLPPTARTRARKAHARWLRENALHAPFYV